jgi:hypothetical protein
MTTLKQLGKTDFVRESQFYLAKLFNVLEDILKMAMLCSAFTQEHPYANASITNNDRLERQPRVYDPDDDGPYETLDALNIETNVLPIFSYKDRRLTEVTYQCIK